MSTPRERFLAALGQNAVTEQSEAFAEPLDHALRAAAARWPDIAVSPEDFSERLGALAARTNDWGTLLDAERSADLYLAFGCLRGDRRAIAYFEQHFMRDLESKLRNVDADELQKLRERLLLARNEAEPKLAEYVGRGALRNWLRIVALRQFASAAKARSRETATDERFFAAIASPNDDLETEQLKTLYRSEFKEAFKRGVEALEDRERRLLRYAIVERMSFDDLAVVFAVSRATIGRWLSSARATLIREVRAALRKKLGVTEREVDSILRLVQSRIDITIDRYLVETEESASGH